MRFPNGKCRDYAASQKVCAACQLRKQCTRNKSGRTIKRHLRQEELDGMREASRSAKAKRDIKMMQHLMERSYARGVWYGFDRARWRGLWRVQIQEYLIAAIQNIQVLLRYGSYLKKGPSVMMEQIKRVMRGEIRFLLDYTELVGLKIGRRVPFSFTYPRLSFIEA
jgi:Transposase DDE domain